MHIGIRVEIFYLTRILSVCKSGLKYTNEQEHVLSGDIFPKIFVLMDTL